MEPTDIEIQEVVESTWSAFLQADVIRLGAGELPARHDGDGRPPLVGRVAIAGAWEGEVLFRCDEELGRTAAAVFFDMAPEAVEPAEIRDAVAELTNVLGGNLKCLLPAGCRLSLPRVEAAVPEGNGAVSGHTVAFRCGEQPFWVAVRRHR